MGVTVAATRVACNTATGEQDITTSNLGGLTPKAALFIVTYATTDGTATDHYVLGFGACDDTNEWCMGLQAENNQDTSDTDNGWNITNCVRIWQAGTRTTDGEADFVEFITNGVTIDWTNAPSSAYLLTVVFFAGTDLSVHCGQASFTGDTVDEVVDVTAPGFTPELIIACTPRAGTGGGIDALGTFGFIHWDGVSTVTQRSVGTHDRDGQDTTVKKHICSDDYGLWQPRYYSTSGIDWGGEFSDFDANGFSITARVSGANSQDVQYLAMDFNGAVDSLVGTYTTPTSGGDDDETGIGFEPQFVMLMPGLAEVVDTEYLDGRGGTLGFSVFDANNEYCMALTSEQGQDFSDTQSLSDDTALNVPDHDGSNEYTASFVEFLSNGFTLNYSTAPSTAKVMPMLAIGTEAAADERLIRPKIIRSVQIPIHQLQL